MKGEDERVDIRPASSLPAGAALHLLLAAALALASCGVAAAWVPIGESESTSYYLDADSVRSEGAHRRVWRLFEYKEQPREGVRSGKALIDIDCRAGTYRYLKTIYYPEAMGQGKSLGGRGEHRKEYIAPGTMIGQLANLVCQPAARK